jgi:2-dehydropantoate 2-reductase
MDAWLKTHAAVVSPIAGALYAAGGDNFRLARTRDGLALLVRAIREGFRVLHGLGVPVTPAYLRLIEWMPEPLLVLFFQLILSTAWAELVLTQHANAARDEMLHIAREFRSLVRSTWVHTPAMDELYQYIDPVKPALQDGSARLPLRWQVLWVWAGALASLILFRKRMKKARTIGISA